jgi:quinoprotein glucose dehydrogenase
LNPVINTLLTSGSDDLRVASAKVTSKLKLTNALPTLFNVVADARSAASVRVAALEALNELKALRLAEAVKLVQTDPDEHVRIQANRLFIRLNPAEAPALLARLLEAGTLRERQDALSALTGLGDKQKADALFVETYDKLLAGKLPPELHLDLVEHTRNRSAEPVKSRFNAWQATKNTNDLLAGWREAFHGGNAQEGKKQFERVELACLRCHKLNGEGGIVGPDLTGIGKRQTREYLLESIVHPNSKIAAGFEDVLVVLKNGQSFAGRLKKETDTELVLDSPEDGEIKVKKADLKRRERSLSAMPDNFLRIMSKWDVRNLVEFLATQQ